MSGTAQENFLRTGGPLAAVLQHKYETGELSSNYEYQEWPKWIANPRARVEKVKRHTEVIRGNGTTTIEWEEEVVVDPHVLVHSEEEAERVRTGGMSDGEIEESRQKLIHEAKVRGIRVDPSWGIARLEEMLGQRPLEAIASLQAQAEAQQQKIDLLQRLADQERMIAELQAQLAGRQQPPADERDELRRQLQSLGVEIDMRWGAQRLRDELDEATRPRR